MLKWFLLALFVLSVVYVHMRGRVRHRFFRQLIDHSGLLAPLNVLMYAFSKVPNEPYIATRSFPDLAELERHWPTIRDEGVQLMREASLRAPDRHDDAGFNSFAKAGWKRFYLKWYDQAHPSAARLCPQTTALLRDLKSVKAAMFAELPVGAVLNPHRDPYAGSLRYHLGLVTPNDDRCYIDVDGERYSWRDGEGVVFDETFIHTARNDAGSDRLILFCDIERPMRWRWAQAVNHWVGRHLVAAASSPNEAGDKVGVINRLFFISHTAGQWRRRFKRWNEPVYQLTRVALVAAVVGLFVWL